MESTTEQPSSTSGRVTWEQVRHFFTAQDVTCMAQQSGGRIELNKHDSVRLNAQAILGQVKHGNMPPAHSGEKPWSADRVAQFEAWIAGGCP
jgi:hypothetical protein